AMFALGCGAGEDNDLDRRVVSRCAHSVVERDDEAAVESVAAVRSVQRDYPDSILNVGQQDRCARHAAVSCSRVSSRGFCPTRSPIVVASGNDRSCDLSGEVTRKTEDAFAEDVLLNLISASVD